MKTYPQLFFMVLCLTIASCDAGPNEQQTERPNPHSFNFVVHEDCVVVIDRHYCHPGGTLHSIQRNEGEWMLDQTIDLVTINAELEPDRMAMNEKWLAINLTTIERDARSVLLLKRNQEGAWEYADTLESPLLGKDPSSRVSSKFGSSLAFAANDLLLCGDPYHGEKGGFVYCYDLSQGQPILSSTILSEEGFNGFGSWMKADRNLLLIQASGRPSSSEIDKYNIPSLDMQDGDGKDLYPKKDTYIAYAYHDGTWSRLADLWDFVVEESFTKEIAASGKDSDGNAWSPPDVLTVHLANSQVFAKTKYELYVFNWANGELQLETHYDLPIKDRRRNTSIRIDIGQEWTVQAVTSKGALHAYPTAELSDWSPLSSCQYIDEGTLEEVGWRHMIYPGPRCYDGFEVQDDFIAISYAYAEAYFPGHALHEIPVWAEFAIYEMDVDTGLTKQFCMQANDDSGLQVVPATTEKIIDDELDIDESGLGELSDDAIEHFMNRSMPERSSSD